MSRKDLKSTSKFILSYSFSKIFFVDLKEVDILSFLIEKAAETCTEIRKSFREILQCSTSLRLICKS